MSGRQPALSGSARRATLGWTGERIVVTVLGLVFILVGIALLALGVRASAVAEQREATWERDVATSEAVDSDVKKGDRRFREIYVWDDVNGVEHEYRTGWRDTRPRNSPEQIELLVDPEDHTHAVRVGNHRATTFFGIGGIASLAGLVVLIAGIRGNRGRANARTFPVRHT
ncbi:DUF3592 domain-containing protein [Brevibacterium samyangense]|uniref:DUF3592 domain-containing protein n=1 Tax=Brevibacterium samyangense TaxID=366888 RepID=A0ABP5EKM5_9MICO